MKDYEEFFDHQYYELFAEIRRRKICPKQLYRNHGSFAAFTLNARCPVVVKHGGLPLDEWASELGLESTCDFYEMVFNYKPKYKVIKEVMDYYEHGEEES